MVGWYVVPFGAMLLGLAPWLVVSLLCRVLMRDICEVLGCVFLCSEFVLCVEGCKCVKFSYSYHQPS